MSSTSSGMRSRRLLLTSGSSKPVERLLRQAGFRHQLAHREAGCAAPRDAQAKLFFERGMLESFQPCEALRLAQVGQRLRIEHAAPTDGGRRRTLPQHEAVTGYKHDGLVQPEPHESMGARLH